MPQINKVVRDKDIKQVSRTNDLIPAKEKAVPKTVPKISEPKETLANQAVTAQMKAAQRAGVAAIRHARTISSSSDQSEDQEAIDKLETSALNAAADSADAAWDAKDSLKRQIRKKRPDIKNKKDIKSGARTIRKADNTIKMAQKNAAEASKVAMKSANEAAKQAAIASQKVVSAKKAERLAKKSAEWVKKIVKGIVNAVKRLLSAIGAASVPLLLILVLAGSIAALVASAFGIFFAGDQSGEHTRTLQEVVMEINSDYLGTIDNIEKTVAHDEVTKEGYSASWPDVLSVYAVYVTTKTDGATDVVHITDDHVKILKDIYWQMTTVTYTTEVVTETRKVPDLDADGNQKKDADGNLLYKEETTSKTILHIKISHLTAAEEAKNLSFNTEQMAQLNELLDTKNASLWAEIHCREFRLRA